MAHVTTSMMQAPATCVRPLAHHSRSKIAPAFRTRTKLTPRPSHRRAPTAPQAGLFDIFTGGASAPKSSPQKDELVQELYEAVEGTQAGLKANSAKRERINELVEQLARYSVRSPTRSELFWGEWEIAYCSKATAPGGPFRSAPGRAVFADQRIRQSLQKPDTLVNIVEFKTLGFLPGSSQQVGELTIIDGQRYQVNLGKPSIAVVGAAAAEAPADAAGTVRNFRTLYLDEIFRVAQFEPEDEDREPVLFVFQRLTTEEEEEAAEEEEEEEEEEEAPVVPARRTRGSGRAAAEQEPAAVAPRGGTRVVGRRGGRQQQEEAEEEEEAALEPVAKSGFESFFGGFGRAKKQADSLLSAAASAASTVEETARSSARQAQAQAATRAEQQERRAELQAGIDEYAEAAKEAAAEAKELSQALKATEREASGLLRGAALPRSRLEAARSAVAAVLAELEEAQEEEREAIARAKDSAAEVKELERSRGARR